MSHLFVRETKEIMYDRETTNRTIVNVWGIC